MRLLSLCLPEFHAVAKEEARSLVSAAPEETPFGIVFDCSDEEAVRFTYNARISRRTIALLGTFAASDDLEETAAAAGKVLESFSLGDWCDAKTFSVICEREGSHAFSSQDVVSALAQQLRQRTDAQFTFKAADIALFIAINGSHAAVGIDLCGFALDKRDYRLFAVPADVKGTIAAGILAMAGYDGSVPLHNFFCLSGTVAIEAALISSQKSPHAYRKNDFAFLRLKQFSSAHKLLKDSTKAPRQPIHALDAAMRNVRFAEKNAKIAGVNKLISFSRLDTEFLDGKFPDESVRCAIASLPSPSKSVAESAVRPLLEQFFVQMGYLLTPDAMLLAITRKQEPLHAVASGRGFACAHTRTLHIGGLTLFISTFKKAASKE